MQAADNAAETVRWCRSTWRIEFEFKSGQYFLSRLIETFVHGFDIGFNKLISKYDSAKSRKVHKTQHHNKQDLF